MRKFMGCKQSFELLIALHLKKSLFNWVTGIVLAAVLRYSGVAWLESR